MKSGTAWLVPGQGEDLRAFGDLPQLAQTERAQTERFRLFALISDALSFDVTRALRDGHPRMLDTEVAQPVAVALSLALGVARKAHGEEPFALAGLSLGELAAVACADALSEEDAVRAAIVRGRLMAEAARAVPGGMLALNAVDEDDVARALAAGRAAGQLVIAGRNSPTQWVLSGDHAALRAVSALRPTTALRVQGAWHSPAMSSVVAPWETFLRKLTWRPLAHPLALAGRATIALPGAGEELVRSLLDQLTGPTQWLATLRLLRAQGATDVEVLGPARTLRALWRESAPPEPAIARTVAGTAPMATAATATPRADVGATHALDTPSSPAPEQDPAWLAAHELAPLEITSAALSRLLPQRPPLALVDRVWARGVAGRAHPALLAALQLCGDEDVLRGHFPGHPVWPGVYTVEGLAQACILAGALAHEASSPA